MLFDILRPMVLSFSIIFFLTMMFFPSDAHAYIDPGAGSMFVQLILGTAIGLLIWFRRKLVELWDKAKMLFSRQK